MKLETPGTNALHELVDFVRRVRADGVPASTAQSIDLTRAAALVGLRSYADLRAAARCSLAAKREEIPVIDREFDRLWDRLAGLPGREPTLESSSAGLGGPAADTPDFDSQVSSNADLEDGLESDVRNQADEDIQMEVRPGLSSASAQQADGGVGEQDGSAGRAALYSAGESIRKKDFAEYSSAEAEEAKRFVAVMRWRPPMRRSRRRRPARQGAELDMRRLMRRSVRHGGEIPEFPHRTHQLRPRMLVVLCDVSGSMDIYTRMLLRFLHSLQGCCSRTEVFLFGTRLTRVTRLLARESPDRALDRLAGQVQDWSGGTRIGDSLSTFNRVWARRVAAHGAVTLIISDGWDRGDPSQLSREMAHLRRLSHRVVWLNPLLGAAAYEPLTQGLVASLPFVDDFIPAHNIESLESLAELLNGLG